MVASMWLFTPLRMLVTREDHVTFNETHQVKQVKDHVIKHHLKCHFFIFIVQKQ